MSRIMVIRNIEGIRWDKEHAIPEQGITMNEFIKSRAIQVGDTVEVENKAECVLPLTDDQYCITFDKDMEDGGSFFCEEPFTKDECKVLFGNDFDY